MLAAAGVPFEIVTRPAEELHDNGIAPRELCLMNAGAKADAVYSEFGGATVIGADTLVFLDGRALGKPSDLGEARRMLSALSGRVHRVCTGVSVRSPLGHADIAVVTEVEFRELTPSDIDCYLSLVDVLDKAGGYALQEHGDLIIQRVAGDTDNVIGLPVDALLQQLRRLGYFFKASCS